MSENRFFELRQSLLLLLAASIWGFAFVAQSVGMEHLGPFTFNAVRFLLGAVTLSPFILARSLKQKGRNTGSGDNIRKTERSGGKKAAAAGIFCGTALCIATNLQQAGIIYTSVGKAGFLTAMYIVVVPLLSVFLGRRAGKNLVIAVIFACGGLYFLCMSKGDTGLGRGDLLCLLSAVFFALQILIIDHFAEGADPLKLAAVQFLTASLLSGVFMLFLEKPAFSQIYQARLPLLYAGVLSSGVAYTLQIVGQRGMNPAVASLVMSLESPVSVLAGFMLLKEALSARELGGCVLMACAVILAQIPDKSD